MKFVIALAFLALVAVASSQEASGCTDEIKTAATQVLSDCRPQPGSGNGGRRWSTTPASRKRRQSATDEKGPNCAITKFLANDNLAPLANNCSASADTPDFQRFHCMMEGLQAVCPDFTFGRPGGHHGGPHGRPHGGPHGQDSSSEEDA